MVYMRRKWELELQAKKEKLEAAEAKKAAKGEMPGAGRKRAAGEVLAPAEAKKRNVGP